MIVYSSCPCCNTENIVKTLSAKDHTVSGEIFEIWHCKACTARFTQNIPGKDEISKYYQSAEYISHSDTRTGFINSMYHRVRKRTLAAKRKLIQRQTKL